jgi:hypothetical protein
VSPTLVTGSPELIGSQKSWSTGVNLRYYVNVTPRRDGLALVE